LFFIASPGLAIIGNDGEERVCAPQNLINQTGRHAFLRQCAVYTYLRACASWVARGFFEYLRAPRVAPGFL